MTAMVAPNLARKAATSVAWATDSRATGSAAQENPRRRRARALVAADSGSARSTLARGFSRRFRVWAARPLTKITNAPLLSKSVAATEASGRPSAEAVLRQTVERLARKWATTSRASGKGSDMRKSVLRGWDAGQGCSGEPRYFENAIDGGEPKASI